MNIWPSWRYGPDKQAKIFQRPEDVPEGWADSPDRVPAIETGIPVSEVAQSSVRGEPPKWVKKPR